MKGILLLLKQPTETSFSNLYNPKIDKVSIIIIREQNAVWEYSKIYNYLIWLSINI